MLVELLRPGGPELIRRWVAALLLAPDAEREAIVNEVERSLVELYAEPLSGGPVRESKQDENDETPVVHIVSPPEQREGYVEQVERSYSPPSEKKSSKAKAKAKAKVRPKSRGAGRA